MNESKIVNFPKAKASRGPKTDAELVAEIRRAHRKLARTIEAARYAGLRVDTDWSECQEPRVTREL